MRNMGLKPSGPDLAASGGPPGPTTAGPACTDAIPAAAGARPLTRDEWLDQDLRQQFDAWYASFTPEQRAEAKQKFESSRAIATGRDTYGMKSHVTYRNNVRGKS